MDPLAIVKKASSQRAGLLSVGTISSPNTTLPGNVSVVGSLSVAGEITNNVTGALSLRVFDDTGLYALRTLTVGNPLPSPLTSKPVLEQQIASINLSNPTFGTISAGYSLKINGYVQPPSTGTYLFRTTYRDGASLYVAARKLLDSWTYQGTVQQSVGTLTMYQNVWYNFAIEHAAASSAERLLVEWSYPGGTYATLQHGTGAFTFAYDMKEIPGSLMGTSYVYGRANFADVANLSAGIALPNAALFSGNTSELNNDLGFLKNGFSTLSGTSLSIAGTVSTGALAFLGTSAGTNIQLINSTTVSAGTTTTIAYAGLGVTPGTALDNYALTGHRWWTGSSGTSSGTAAMQLFSTGLTVSGTVSAAALSFVGTSAGTILQLANTIATLSGTVTTTSYGAFGVTPGTSLDRYALNAHRWWTGSSGTSSGAVGMQLNSSGLTISNLTATSASLTSMSASQNPAFKAVGNGPNIAVPQGGVLVFPATLFDRTSMYSTVTGKWTITQAGVYLMSCSLYLASQAPSTTLIIAVYVNNSDSGRLFQQPSGSSYLNIVGSNIFKLNPGDVVNFYSSSAISLYGGDTSTSQISCAMLS